MEPETPKKVRCCDPFPGVEVVGSVPGYVHYAVPCPVPPKPGQLPQSMSYWLKTQGRREEKQIENENESRMEDRQDSQQPEVEEVEEQLPEPPILRASAPASNVGRASQRNQQQLSPLSEATR